MIITDVINVLKTGQELKDPAKWKNRHWLATTVGLFVTAAMGLIKWKFPDLPITEETISDIQEFVFYGLSIAGVYIIPASTTKIGIKPKKE
jgi:hypothetical protein